MCGWCGEPAPRTPSRPLRVALPPRRLPAAGSVVQTSRQVLPVEATVRVPAARLDRLVNLVGELVMNQSRLAQAAAQIGAPELANPVQEIERLVGELRDDVLGIRMLPIGTIFGRFRRLVHDPVSRVGQASRPGDGRCRNRTRQEHSGPACRAAGSPVAQFARPRNRKHGGTVRRAGKPPRATIRLSAVHTGSDVVGERRGRWPWDQSRGGASQGYCKSNHRRRRETERQRDGESGAAARLLDCAEGHERLGTRRGYGT